MYSTSGEGAQILLQIKREGNEVGLYIKDKIYKTVFDGLVQKVNNPDDFIDKNTVIIFDISGNGDVADHYKKKGNLVYGGGSFQDKLEHDRAFGFNAMERSGIQIPRYKEFVDFGSGILYAQSHKQRLVFKPSGTMPCKLTYVSKDTEELIAFMKFVERYFSKDIDSFILQDFIEGVVVSSECFSSPNGFLCPNHTVEVKKSMNGDLGPSTGCAGNVTWPCENSKIISAGVNKVEQFCIDNGLVGQIDLNAVVNDSGVYGLEWTPRFGYDATPTLLYILNGEFGSFFYAIATGQTDDIKFENEFAASVRVSIPPYPAETDLDPEKFSPNKGVPILNYKNYESDIYFYEIELIDDQIVHSGGTGVICCALGCSDYPEVAIENAEDIAEEIVIPDKQYRTDLVDVLSEMICEVEHYA